MDEERLNEDWESEIEDTVLLSDAEIQTLITDSKKLPATFFKELRLKNKENRSYKEYELEAQSNSGRTFRIRIRVNTINRKDFSIILLYIRKNKRQHILRRYNGIHFHRNKIEKNGFREYHIHFATQRYQEKGHQIEGYAEVTNSYTNWEEALNKMLEECNFKGEISFLSRFG